MTRNPNPRSPVGRGVWIGFAAVLAALVILALLRFRLIRIPFLADQAKEWVIGAGLMFLLLRIRRRNPFGMTNPDRKIRLFGLGLLALGALGLPVSSLESWASGGSAFLRLLGATLFQTAGALVVTAFAVGLFGLYRELVFVQQGRRTERLFGLFELAVALRVLFALIPTTDRALFPPSREWADGPNPPLILTAVLAVLLGFRCKWIAFLNKRSKVALFLLGIPVAVLFLSQRESLTEAVLPFSVAGESVISSLLLAFGVYLVVSLVSLCIHLPTAGLLDRRMREVRSFQELSAMLGADLKKDALVAKIPLLAARMVEAETVCLELDEGFGLKLPAAPLRGIKPLSVELSKTSGGESSVCMEEPSDIRSLARLRGIKLPDLKSSKTPRQVFNNVESESLDPASRAAGNALADGFRPASIHRAHPDSPGMLPEAVRAAVRRVVLDRMRPVLMNDAAKSLKGWKTPESFSGSLLAAPVAFQSKVIGVLTAMKSSPFGFVEESQGLFEAFAHQAAISLQNARLVELSISREKAEEELRLAHEAQMRLLPQAMPIVRGFELDGICITANEIGGDFYDVIASGRDRIDIIVGDVSGKGAAAAFIMAETKGALRTLAGRYGSPKEILAELNGFFREQGDPGLFLTMAYAILTPSRRRIRIARAGHCPIGLIRNGRPVWMEPKGIGLGLAEDKLFRSSLREKDIVLKPGDQLFFYTDGLVEARNANGEEFGEDRLTGLLAAVSGSASVSALVRSVTGRLETFTGGVARHDDVTVLALRCGLPRRRKKG
jgi:serine phosphatase RsbU (regulator of sigma subunit)